MNYLIKQVSENEYYITDEKGKILHGPYKEEQTCRVVISEVFKDPINPQHYRNGKVECIVALEAATVNKTGIEAVCTANVIKYLWRYEAKNGLEDVKKAKWYLEELIKHLESKKPAN